MIQRISRISVHPTAVVVAVALGGVGVLMAVISALFLWAASDGGFAVPAFSFMPFAIWPVAYAVMGYVVTAIWIVIYNLAAKSTGGIEIELSEPGVET